MFDVLDYLAGGMAIEVILGDFPQLTRDGMLACLAYAGDREHWIGPS
ncbi:hypothetical protein OP10G_3142 [Fimbriimonas ginsengisoli Gsoil 348]|uniref:DUF433 domain-containing protein n=1 Tax=Fimbriimonas ginsengisoli Gsoil 348 TaxID=661478 RepID=A0A068NUS2_FIMGI|nr:hypothetical protein OP10G_3142 [Fimbriimonas ginsengisoli Gsoil 348]